jgi:putative membrane protein
VLAALLAPAASAAAGGASQAERALSIVHLGNQAEIKDAKLALRVGRDLTVRRFATMLQKDHTEADAKVAALARTIDARLLTAAGLGSEGQRMLAEHEAAYRDLAGHEGAAFDRAFLEHEIRDHEKVIAKVDELVQAVSPGSKVGAFLQTLRPKLKHHLDQATLLHQRIGG